MKLCSNLSALILCSYTYHYVTTKDDVLVDTSALSFTLFIAHAQLYHKTIYAQQLSRNDLIYDCPSENQPSLYFQIVPLQCSITFVEKGLLGQNL